ncbi:MAG: NADH-quinone oxidoreductase subunit 5 family protein [Ilumatobacteraceae bacterium]
MIGATELSSGWFLENAWLIAVVPAVAYFFILFFGKRMPKHGAEFGIASMAAALVLATGALVQWVQRVDQADEASGEHGASGIAGFAQAVVPRVTEGEAEPYVEPVIRTWTWWQSGGFEFTIGTHMDGLAILILWLVAFISLLVQIYSLEFVRGDRRFTHFFSALTLFSSGMLVMALAENMVQFILGWEIMGLCSFMLIGHWWEENYNSESALKAFWTVRVGDVGLLVGVAIIFFGANAWAVDNLGSNGFSIQAIEGWALSGEGSSSVLFWGAVALFIAAIGKSGQFPLHTWLPDAMAGPTPVSSLLHSSTMVVAGVFLVARLFPVFWAGFDMNTGAVTFIGVIGMITIIIAALLAFVQDDIKKVLAYSTVSQLGYMMLGLGTGAWLPAVFHIFTHAFFKCGLFLLAGSISHSGSHHSFDMKTDMGGLRKPMPITFWCWIICTGALCGVPPLAGFWSKDEIIDNVGNNGYTLFFWGSLFGAALTAMYMTRATYLTFFGKPRGAAAGEHHDDDHHSEDHELDEATVGAPMSLSAGANVLDDGGMHPADGDDAASGHHGGHDDHDEHHDDHGPHESPALLMVPILILTFFAIVAGFFNATPLGEDWELIKKYVEPRPEAVQIEDVRASGPGESLQLVVPRADEGEGAKKSGCGFDDPELGTVCFFPKVTHAVPEFGKIMLSVGVVGAAFAIAIPFCIQFYGRRNPRLVGLTERHRSLRGGYLFLKNKYYLDDLYNGFFKVMAYPVSKATYWTNQHIIDEVVNEAGENSKKAGRWVYKYVDQGLIDGVADGSGTVAEETGHALQPVQSGKVSQYGALLFGAAAVGAIALVIINL